MSDYRFEDQHCHSWLRCSVRSPSPVGQACRIHKAVRMGKLRLWWQVVHLLLMHWVSSIPDVRKTLGIP